MLADKLGVAKLTGFAAAVVEYRASDLSKPKDVGADRPLGATVSLQNQQLNSICGEQMALDVLSDKPPFVQTS